MSSQLDRYERTRDILEAFLAKFADDPLKNIVIRSFTIGALKACGTAMRLGLSAAEVNEALEVSKVINTEAEKFGAETKGLSDEEFEKVRAEGRKVLNENSTPLVPGSSLSH